MAEKFTNIAGGPFLPYVANEIEKRKKFLEESNIKRENKHLIYLNNKNSWIRLTSCVDVQTSHPLFKKYGLSGDALAKKYILQGGTVEGHTNSSNEYTGITNRSGVGKDGVYGMLEGRPLGFKPMPGITSIDLSSAGKLGTLQYASIKFICYDLEQLELFDALYMKLGFSLVLEWGHTVYLDENLNLKKPLPLNVFQHKTKESLVKAIQNKRVSHSGNYDAMIGVTSNFGWEAQSDGSYICDIKLVGAGDILESLKINQAVDKNVNFSFTKKTPITESEDITITSRVADKDLSLLNNALFSINERVIALDTKLNGTSIVGTSTPKYRELLNKIFTHGPYNFIKFKEDGNIDGDPTAIKGNHYSLISEINRNNGGPEIEIPTVDNTLFSAIRVPYKMNPDGGITEDSVYITLGHLLALLTSTGMIYDKVDGVSKPHIYLDFNDSLNYCSTFRGQISMDPRVCIIPRNQNNLDDPFGLGTMSDELFNSLNGNVVQMKNVRYVDEEGKTKTKRVSVSETGGGGPTNGYLNVTSSEKEVRARMMYIAININYITDILRQQRENDGKGKVNLSDFLNTILEGISKSLCGFNEFRISIDDSNKCMRIIDDNKTSLRSELEDINQYTEIPLYGNKSIVYNYSFKSKIGPNMASMITIAAQAHPESLGDDAFAISNLSRGLIDRVATEKTSSKVVAETLGITSSNTNQISVNNLDTLKIHLKQIMGETIFKVDVASIDPSINTYKELISEFRTKIDSTNRASIIIPLDFSLEMDGISGIIPNSAFTIPVNLLPSSYKTIDNKQKIAFIIHSINQNFADNKWTTKITGQTINIRFDKEDIQAYIEKLGQAPTGLTDVNSGVYFEFTNYTAGNQQARKSAESYLGRKMSDKEWNQLIAATFAESSSNQTERAYVAAAILNRARKYKVDGVTQVLYEKNQFQSVTGTKNNGHTPSINYTKGPDQNNQNLIFGAIQNILIKVPWNIINFTAADPKAYGAGTNVKYLQELKSRGGIIIGKTIFSK